MQMIVAIVFLFLLTNCTELHIHWDKAKLRPVTYSYVPGDNIQYGLGFELGENPLIGHDIISKAEHLPVGLLLKIPFDLGWLGPYEGPHWMVDLGYSIGIYSSPVLIDGR